MYDRLWNRLGSERIAVLDEIPAKLELVRHVPQSAGSNSIVLCESVDLENFDRNGLLGSLSRGPRSDSIFGWLPWSFLDPLVELREGVIPSPDAPTHGLQVANVILAQNDAATLIPISMPNCMKAYSTWAPTVAGTGARVVNFSGTEAVDYDWCQKFFDPSSFLGPDKPFLWVVPAGNEGKENPVRRCPQRFAAENLIVAAGGSDGGLWGNSDYGLRYADIAADPDGTAGESGTSYSAGRISAVAAKIAGSYPNLLPRDIRVALLAAANIGWGPLPVRSGGALNDELALKIASSLAEVPHGSINEKLLRPILELHLSKREAERKLTLFKERKILP